jgi:anthranilate phosphoribosyltransferase
MNEDLTLEEAFVVARDTIDSGRAYKKYEEYRNASVSL